MIHVMLEVSGNIMQYYVYKPYLHPPTSTWKKKQLSFDRNSIVQPRRTPRFTIYHGQYEIRKKQTGF
jgi:hypothetical protein